MNAEHFKKWLALGAEGQNQVPLVMGILNLTPDSFSDGGKFNTLEHAYLKALEMIEQGADIIDIGAESSRPGAKGISAAEEIERIKPFLKHLRQATDICISIDTYKPEVMAIALDLGVDVINDIFALTKKGSIELLRQYDVPVCLMHQDTQHHAAPPHLWQEHQDICQAVLHFFEQRLKALEANGIKRKRFILDPGIGFGKVGRDSLRLIGKMNELSALGLPILVGASRKRFIGEVLDRNIDARTYGGAAVTACAFMGGANIHRTHDVAATKDTLLMLRAILDQDIKND